MKPVPSHGSALGATTVDDHVALRRQLLRLQRRGRWKAIGLIAPLMVFLALVFVVPIVLLLARAVDNHEVPAVLPQTSIAMKDWNGDAPPTHVLADALIVDLRTSPREAVAEVAKRLNYYQSGLRSMVLKTAREVNNESASNLSGLERLKEIDERWLEPATWSVIQRALPPTTDFYLLASLDLRRDAQGAIVAATGDSAIYRDVIVRTFVISAAVTLLCLLLGYPLAYWIAIAAPRTARLLLLMVLLPFWTSLLVRTTAWVVVLQSGGVVNSLLGWLGLIDPAHPLELIHNRIGVLIAMTHILLPFMALPIYSVMKSIPPNYMRAAASLGASPLRAFLRVYLPLSLPGISAGCLLVFILALGYYITPALVGGPRDQMLSYFIAYFASQVTNWGMAAALSATLLVLVLLLYAVYHRMVGIDKLRMG
ncbi:ABC transporter permease [Rhodoferax sp. GW822-FHT02A01]|uniref:ABC transporter permease n=1 Tax=Rhodoferax sp. GW822-FHT02A01 TaxID=3141537 RepID=UPI00315C4F8A